VPSKFGSEKLCLVLHLASNPGDAPGQVAEALQTLGISFKAINSRGKKQRVFSPDALTDALAQHAKAKFGTTTELLEHPKVKLHGPTSFARVSTRILAKGSSRPGDERFPPVIEIFWSPGGEVSVPGRKELDRFLKVLTGAVSVRVGAAGVAWGGIERPMMKDGPAVAAEMLAAMLARPHAHSNHRSLLDTTSAGLEPGFWNFFGADHLSRLDKSSLARAKRTDFGSAGASFALFEAAPLEATREVLEAHTTFARSLGPLYPPRPISELSGSLSIPKSAGFSLSRWLERYSDEELLERLRWAQSVTTAR
jgi:hypothetical protein